MRIFERVYRVALRSYPACYRAAREEEILSTLAEGQGERVLPRAGELLALVRAGLGERNRADLARGGRWWRGLGSLAVPLTCVNAAVALAGLWVAWSLSGGPGRWWPAFAALALALAIAAAARLMRVAAVLGLVNLGLVAFDAATMLANGSQAAPHLRLLEHYPSSGAQVRLSTARFGSGPAFPEPSASVPSNPSELVPFGLVLALACLGAMLSRNRGLGAGTRVARAGLTVAVAATFAGIALADPDGRFAFLLVPALAIAAAGLIASLFHARAAVVTVAILVASAPSVFWYFSSSLRIEQLGGGLASATRNVAPGLLAVGLMLAAAGIAGAFARRAVRIERETLSR
jgi:hypothetical protein